MANKKVSTIQDVADFAQVSKGTVSKYLNGVSYVSAKTKERIGEAILALEFQPNSLARGLARRSSGLLGLVVADFENPMNLELVKAVETEAAKHGYNVVLASTNDDTRNENMLPETIYSHYGYLDGLILANARDKGIELEALKERFSHLMMVHRHIPSDWCDYVVINGYLGGRRVAEYLVELGHRRFAMISGPEAIYQFQQRVQGFRGALRDNGCHEGLILVEASQSIKAGYDAAMQVFDSGKRVTALFAVSDLLALGALEAARDRGIRVPEQISIVGFDNIVFSRLAYVPLTTMDARFRDLGSLAVSTLVRRIRGENDSSLSQVMLEPMLCIRTSTAKPGGLGE